MRCICLDASGGVHGKRFARGPAYGSLSHGHFGRWGGGGGPAKCQAILVLFETHPDSRLQPWFFCRPRVVSQAMVETFLARLHVQAGERPRGGEAQGARLERGPRSHKFSLSGYRWYGGNSALAEPHVFVPFRGYGGNSALAEPHVFVPFRGGGG